MEEIPAELEDVVESAANDCPTGAIEVK